MLRAAKNLRTHPRRARKAGTWEFLKLRATQYTCAYIIIYIYTLGISLYIYIPIFARILKKNYAPNKDYN